MTRYEFIANDCALDFVNTSFARGDSMPDFSAFVSWLATAGALTADEVEAVLAGATEPVGHDVVRRAHALRSAMRRTVETYVGGNEPNADDLTVINAHLRYAPVHDELVATINGFTSSRRVETDIPDALLYFPAEAAHKLFTRKDAHAIRRCANEACTHYFYDASKNGTRRWCSMASCGNREKVAALRKRRRAG